MDVTVKKNNMTMAIDIKLKQWMWLQLKKNNRKMAIDIKLKQWMWLQLKKTTGQWQLI